MLQWITASQKQLRQYTADCILQANAIINDHAKRLKQAEHQAGDLQKRCDELNSDLQSSNSENQRVTAELTRLKTTVNDQQSKIDALTRENNKLSGQIYTQTQSMELTVRHNSTLVHSGTEWAILRMACGLSAQVHYPLRSILRFSTVRFSTIRFSTLRFSTINIYLLN